MKKFFSILLGLLFLLPNTASAVEFDLNSIRPIITGDDIVKAGKNIIFDSSSSFILEGVEGEVEYSWDLGDGTVIVGDEVVHTYANPGNYTVQLTITQGEKSQAVTKEVFAYSKLVMLLTDAIEWQENILNLKNDAAQEGILMLVVDSYNSTTAFQSEESLYNQLNDNLSAALNADGIAVWTTRGSGMNALTRLAQQSSEKEEATFQDALANKTVLIITDENIRTLGRIVQGNFDIIEPKQMVITREYELRNYIESENDEAFIENLKKSVSDYQLINEESGKISLWNAISYLVSFMIAQGIPSNTIMLLLMLPVIATIIAVLKQVVGITTFGVYTPSIITLSFLALGLRFGLLILCIIIITGAFVRKFLDRFHLLHIPRVAIVLTISSLIILLTLAFGTYLGVGNIATIAVFPMLIMTTLAEKFVTALSGKGFHSALLLMLETTFVSFICYWVVEWHYLQNLILGHPEIILLLLVFNYLLGRWTGLRLMEYVRFREVMKHSEE